MVQRQIAARGVDDPRVLRAMRQVPREAFVDEQQRQAAYEDRALPIGEGQTISQPYIVALMVAAARPRPDDRALEIGTGSGYAAAVLSRLVAQVCTVERHPLLAEVARERFARLGYDNIAVRIGDGTRGWPERAPFDVILVSAGGPALPPSLRQQLAPGGRLVMPIGDSRRVQRLERWTRRRGAVGDSRAAADADAGDAAVHDMRAEGEEFERHDLGPVQFVPLIGAEGWAGAMEREQD